MEETLHARKEKGTKHIKDVLEAASNAYHLLFENDRVRVMEVKLKPGEKAPMHNHPSDHVVYVKNNARFKLSFPNGESSEFDLKVGQTLWIEAGPHETENIGTTDGDNVVIELKEKSNGHHEEAIKEELQSFIL